MVTLLYVNSLKFIIPLAVAHEATSSVCHFSFFHIRTAFVIGNYLLHTHYILMQTIFFLQHKEEVEQLISPLSEKDCRVITQEAEIIILPSVVLPWACPQEVIWRTIRGRHSWGLFANLTLCNIICLFRRCTVSSLLWFRRISIWHDFFRSLSLVINIAAPNLRLTLYCKQYIMKQFFLPKKT